MNPTGAVTLGNAAAAHVRFIVWCLKCRYQAEPATSLLRAAEGGTSADPAEMARRYGPETPVADSGGSRPRIRDDVAHHSDLISLGVPR